VLACRRRLAKPQRLRPPLAKLARFRLMRREALMLGAEQRPSNKVCGSFAKLTHDPMRTRATQCGNPSARHRARRPPASLAIRFASVTAKALALRRRSSRHVRRRVPRPSSESCRQNSSSRAPVMRPAFPCAHYLPYAQYALLRSKSGTLSGHPPGGIFDIRWSSALGPAARFGPLPCAARESRSLRLRRP